MPGIVELAWDSTILGGKAGRLDDFKLTDSALELTNFDFVHARVPQSDVSTIWRLEAAGFRFVTVDYALKKSATRTSADSRGFQVIRYCREEPGVTIAGFEVQGSRFHIDPRLRSRIPTDFWDAMIRNHCREFADFVIGAVDESGSLLACVTCFETADAIDMFLVAVHPNHQGRGIGRELLVAVEAEAVSRGKILTTSVVSQNLGAMNFYLRNGFAFSEAFAVLHLVTEG
ncbi:TDP-fucosamine acetyltransferase [compost metagenome]